MQEMTSVERHTKSSMLGLKIMTVAGLVAVAMGLLIVLFQPRPEGIAHALLFWSGVLASIIAMASMFFQLAISMLEVIRRR
jgi:hypothetical protein